MRAIRTMRMAAMSATFLAGSLFAATLSASSAHAQNYPFCLMTGPAQECSYVSMQQCLSSKRGNADFCEPNNTYVGGAESRPARSRMPQ